MLTPEAATDLLLATTCGVLMARHGRQSPGIVVALAVLGAAAALGVLRFSGIATAAGPHQFMVLLASTAALPLLGWALRWPASLPARQPRAACIAIVFGGALGVVLGGLLEFKPWRALCLLLGIGWLLAAAWQRRQPAFFVGVLLLLATGVVQATQWSPGFWSATALVHVLLALGLSLCLAVKAADSH